jgi:enterobactin synthetase component D
MSLQDRLKAWLPSNVHFALADPTQHYPLLGSEKSAVTNAIEKRQSEFSAGRDAARRALVSLGTDPVEIPVNARRGPVWPSGICGSITHSKRICIAVVASQKEHASLGIDAEIAEPLKDNLRKAILHETEQDVSAEDAIKLFSMKEALFKVLFPLGQEWFGFQDAAQIKNDVLQLTKTVGGFDMGTQFNVPTLLCEDHVISFCSVQSVNERTVR